MSMYGIIPLMLKKKKSWSLYMPRKIPESYTGKKGRYLVLTSP